GFVPQSVDYPHSTTGDLVNDLKARVMVRAIRVCHCLRSGRTGYYSRARVPSRSIIGGILKKKRCQDMILRSDPDISSSLSWMLLPIGSISHSRLARIVATTPGLEKHRRLGTKGTFSIPLG